MSFLSPLPYPARRGCLSCLATAVVLAALSAPAAADLTVTIRTDSETANLLLQQPFTVEFVLAGLEPGQQLDFVGITLTMDSYRMGTPGPITRGEMVPTPGASPSDFLSARAPGVADASFFCSGTLESHRITNDGIFFTCNLTPQHAGEVSIQVSFADALLHNAADPDSPIPLPIAAAGSLDVTVFCPADYNNDGGIDGADVQDFFAGWEVAAPLADVNGDGGIDGSDVVTFFDAWESAGC